MKNKLIYKKQFLKMTILWIALSLFLSVTTSLWAAEKEKMIIKQLGRETNKCYKIKSGNENEMCRLFQQNLNRFCNKTLLVCEPQIHPDFAKYFSVPAWEVVDYESHIDMIAQFIRIRAIIPINCSGQCVSETQEKKWREYKLELLKRLESGKIRLVRTRIRIKYDYDNKSKIAYKLVDNICSTNDAKNYEISRKPGLMIIDEDTGNPNEYYSIINKYGCDSIFIYQDNAYFIDLDSLPYCPVIYSRNRIECHYEHIENNKGGKK